MILAFVNPVGTLFHPEPSPEQQQAAAGLTRLLASAELIPVCGLDEIGILQVPAAFTSWQVLLHGAVVVDPDGNEDPAWRRLTVESQRQRAQALTLAHQAALHIAQLEPLGVEVELVERHGLPLVIRMSHPYDLRLALRQGELSWRQWLDEGPFSADLRLLVEERQVTLLPAELTPDRAVNYILNSLPDRPELTIGVSAASDDAAFLSLCDYAVVPGSSETLIRSDPGEE